jgi:hypothetical protein
VRNKPTQNSHPYAEAAYRVIPAADSAFAVEVIIPGSYPTKVSPFSTEAAAETRIAGHRLGSSPANCRRHTFSGPGSHADPGDRRRSSSFANTDRLRLAGERLSVVRGCAFRPP